MSDDDEDLPKLTSSKLKITPTTKKVTTNNNNNQKDEDMTNRLATHSKLRAYEAKRRLAYESKLQSSSLYWHAFRTLMHDSLLETQKADILLKGWTYTAKTYGDHMMSVGEWCIDEKGVPVVDVKKKKKLFEVHDNNSHNNKGGGNISVGGIAGGGGDNNASHHQQSIIPIPTHQPRGPSVIAADFYREETCGSIIQFLAESAGEVGGKYDDLVKYMNTEVLPELSLLSDHLKSEVTFMENLGDSIMNELETAEYEVCRSWDLYYNKTQNVCGSTSEDTRDPPGRSIDEQAQQDGNTAVKECTDVWVEEMKYRMAVAFLSSVWEKCSSELSKLFLSMKDEECNRRNKMKELMIKAMEQQGSVWLSLPSVVDPILEELTEWPMERTAVEEDVQLSIRERAQAIQRDEAEHKISGDDEDPQSNYHDSGLTDVDEGDGNFELSSPLVSDLLLKAKVIEKRSPGMMGTWKVCLAIITTDSFFQLFELPPTCKLHSGSAPEVAFQNLISPVIVPSMEGVRAGIKFPSAKHWFDSLVPSESFALPNCVVSLMDEKKNPNSFEIAETMLSSGASKMFAKTVNRKMQFRAVTKEEARDLMDALKRCK